MRRSSSSSGRDVKWLRWIVRILSLAFVAFWLFIFIGESLEGRSRPDSPGLSTRAVVELAIINAGMLGLLLAWRWELVGGAAALAAFVLASLINRRMLLFYPVAIAAILYLVCWVTDRKRATVARATGAGLPG